MNAQKHVWTWLCMRIQLSFSKHKIKNMFGNFKRSKWTCIDSQLEALRAWDSFVAIVNWTKGRMTGAFKWPFLLGHFLKCSFGHRCCSVIVLIVLLQIPCVSTGCKLVVNWSTTVYFLVVCLFLIGTGQFGDAVSGTPVRRWMFWRWTLDQRCCFQNFELIHSVNPAQLL